MNIPREEISLPPSSTRLPHMHKHMLHTPIGLSYTPVTQRLKQQPLQTN